MPINKLALLRYKIIDRCLQNRFRRWTLEDLINAVSDGLYEYEGIDNGVSKRTIQLDLQNMRSDKLGYEAPIIVVDRKYYTYEDPDYSITNSPLSEQDISRLNEVVALLRQFQGFGQFEDLSAMVTRLEDKVLSQRTKSSAIIHLDRNDLLKGQEWIEPIYKAILKRQALQVQYQSFKAKQAQERTINPYLLKEYNNRWFLLAGIKEGSDVLIHALDRFISIHATPSKPYYPPKHIQVENYFDNVIGVSKSQKQQAVKIEFRVVSSQVPYLTTKPLHPSQKFLRQEEKWNYFSLEVIWNYELEREFIGMGEVIEIISPRRLRSKIKKRIQETLALYEVKSEGESNE